MNLYYLPGACSLASHIVLQETGLPFQLVKVLFQPDGSRTTELEENYFEINSMGYVPALKLDNGEVLTEGPAILQYLADQVPEKQLIPDFGTMERYRLLEMLTFISSEVHKTFSVLYRPNLPESEKEIAVQKLYSRFKYLEDHLRGKIFLMGDTFTIVDAYLFTVMNWRNKFGISIADFPVLEKYLGNLAQRPSIIAAMEAEGLL